MMLKVDKISFKYPGNIHVLKSASYYVERGEAVAIIGPNGSGKTTLLLISAGLLNPCDGLVTYNGRPLKDQLPEIRRKIGFVFQDPDDQLFNPSVYDEIAFALRQIYSDKKIIEDKVIKIAENLDLKDVLHRPPYRLSIGEKRMLTIASVLVYEPEILILDEPTANLSSKCIDKIGKIVMEAKQNNKAIVIASHDVEFVAKAADRVYILNNGVLYGGQNVKTVLTDSSLLKLADMKPPITYQVLKLLNLKFKGKILTIDELQYDPHGSKERNVKLCQ